MSPGVTSTPIVLQWLVVINVQHCLDANVVCLLLKVLQVAETKQIN